MKKEIQEPKLTNILVVISWIILTNSMRERKTIHSKYTRTHKRYALVIFSG